MKIKAVASSIVMAGIGLIASRLVQPPTPANMVNHVVRAVTLIRSAGPHGITEGSGFFIADGLVVTSYHVIEDMRRIVVETYSGRRFRVQRVVVASRRRDFAVLKIPAPAPATLKPSHRVRLADDVFAVGAPMGMADSLSKGIVSQMRSGPFGESLIQHTAPISPGSSGGPLVDGYGNVIGLNNFSVDEGQNMNFALDIDLVMRAVGMAWKRPSSSLDGAYALLDHIQSRLQIDLERHDGSPWQYVVRMDGESERRHKKDGSAR